MHAWPHGGRGYTSGRASQQPTRACRDRMLAENAMNFSTLRRFLPVAILLLGLALFLLLGLSRHFSFDTLSRNHAELTAWVAANGGLAALVFVIGYAVAIAFSLPIGMLVTPLAGYLFGP